MTDEATLDSLLEQIGRDVLASSVREPKRNIFDVGVSFHEAAKRCAEPRKGDLGEIITPTSPMISCFSFACELYMKALLETSKTHGHDLSKLFDHLDLIDQDGIAARYEVMCGRAKPTLRKDIAGMANAFVEWRYIFERGTTKISVRHLAALALSIYQHVRSIRKDWIVKPRLHDSIERELPQDVLSQISLGGGVMVRAEIRRKPSRE